MMLFTLTYLTEKGEERPAVLFTNDSEDKESLKQKFGDFQYKSAHYVPCNELEVPINTVMYPEEKKSLF